MNDELKVVENGLTAAQDEAYKSGTVQYIDSREVAEMIKKNHKDLIRDIKRYIRQMDETNEKNIGERKLAPSDFFIESTYQNSQNRTMPCYNVTKKGCEFIAHKLTGQKGTEFTAIYINRFHEMENVLETQMPSAALQQFMEYQQSLMEELVKMNRSISDRLLALENRKEEPIGITVNSGNKPFTVEEDEKATRRKIINNAVAQMAKAYGWTKRFALHRLYKTLEEVLNINMDDYMDIYGEETQRDVCALDVVVAYDRLYATALRLCNNTINKMRVEAQS